MTDYPKPSSADFLAAFGKHSLRYVVEPLKASAPGRAWTDGLRAIVDHHTAGTNSLKYLLNEGGRFPYVNALIDRDGLVHILTTMSVWGSGDGGPWPGVADKDALHLVAWQTEVEDKGVGQTFTAEQLESLGRLNSALVYLGVPAGNEINHHDWTDGNDPVGGHPLPTYGRKTDTRYPGDILRANTAKYVLRPTRVVHYRDVKFLARNSSVAILNQALVAEGFLEKPSSVWSLASVLAWPKAKTKFGGPNKGAGPTLDYLGDHHGFTWTYR